MYRKNASLGNTSLYDIASDPWPQGIVAIKIVLQGRIGSKLVGCINSMEWNRSSIKCGMEVFNTE